MKMFTRKLAKTGLAMLLGLCLMYGANFTKAWAGAGGVDVYVVYSGKNKQDKSELKKAFANDISVKFYNVDLLAVADYSGKQKAIAKLEKAQIVVIIKDSPMELLHGATFKANLLIVQSVKNTVQSENWTLYVVGKGMNLAGLGKLKTHNASKKADLVDSEKLRASDAVLVDETGLGINKAVSVIVEQTLGS